MIPTAPGFIAVMSILNDVVAAMRSLLTTDEFFDLTRPIPLLLTLAKTARANKVAAFIAAFMKNATNVLGNLTLPGHTGGAYNTDRICIAEKS